MSRRSIKQFYFFFFCYTEYDVLINRNERSYRVPSVATICRKFWLFSCVLVELLLETTAVETSTLFRFCSIIFINILIFISVVCCNRQRCIAYYGTKWWKLVSHGCTLFDGVFPHIVRSIFSLLQLFHRWIYTSKQTRSLFLCAVPYMSVIFSMFLSWYIWFLFLMFRFCLVVSSLFMCSCCCLPCGKNIVLSNRKPMKTHRILCGILPVSFWFGLVLLFLFNLAFSGMMVHLTASHSQ